MQSASPLEIERVHSAQYDFFGTYQTRNVDYRIQQLKNLKSGINSYEEKILEALWKDLHKSKEEAYLTEISIVTREIDLHIKKLRSWVKPRKVNTPIQLWPSSSRINYEPLGVSLIIAPWNYPFQLLMAPLVGAVSAGCCAVLKPSEFTNHIAIVMEELISEIFPEEYIKVIQGGKKVGENLLRLPFDMIFFTGSSKVGKIVMKAAAEHLTPVILELGGKSPCIVHDNANIEKAAKRIVWGKTINAGQTCIAPDYLFVHEAVKEELVQKMQESIREMFGEDVQKSKYYPRIVNEKTFNGLQELLDRTEGKIRSGGRTDREDRFISPTILDEITPGDALMEEEIFGPLLPVMTYNRIEEAISYINIQPKPLALYFFGKEEEGKQVIDQTSAGGTAINDTLMHITNHNLPFGGVGNSGQGKYHGKESFLAFSNQRSIISTPTWVDIPFKYAPFKYFSLIKKIL